jgi:hypothetical protein
VAPEAVTSDAAFVLIGKLGVALDFSTSSGGISLSERSVFENSKKTSHEDTKKTEFSLGDPWWLGSKKNHFFKGGKSW